MGIPLFAIREFIKYKFRAKNAHGIHSPFVFNLYNEVISKQDKSLSESCRRIRTETFRSKARIEYTNPKTGHKRDEIFANWAKRVTSTKKFNVFLIQLINHLEVKTVLETGTAAGINASCLSLSNASRIVTIEGSNEISKIAQEVISRFGGEKVELIQGNVKDIFEEVLTNQAPDLVFLDADHRSETIEFYLDSIEHTTQQPKCILVHDIYWSKDMHQAWKRIVNSDKYTLTIDLFEVGLIFPNFPAQKQDFSIQF
ncbi:MAG: class I SAM-dependent methyltransferase [Cyclobacteriaceae bacterium]